MKLDDSKENYNYSSGKASDVMRQLAFAGLAIVWIFKTEKGGIPHLPQALFVPTGLIIVGLLLDVMHYTYATAAWGLFNRKMEKVLNLDTEKEFFAPRAINWPSLIFFWAKMTAIAVAYFYLLVYAAKQIF